MACLGIPRCCELKTEIARPRRNVNDVQKRLEWITECMVQQRRRRGGSDNYGVGRLGCIRFVS